MTDSSPNADDARPDNRGSVFAVLCYVITLSHAVCLFLGAGTLRWRAAWAYVIVNVVAINSGSRLVTNIPAALDAFQERNAFSGRWNRIGQAIVNAMPYAQFALAGMDAVRWQCSSAPVVLRVIGWLLELASILLNYWTMSWFPYHQTSVCTQADVTNTAFGGGPFRWTRHPTHLATILSLLGVPLLLGSLWALIPSAIAVPLIIAQTAKDDALFHRELPGYAVFATRTKARLLPGAW